MARRHPSVTPKQLRPTTSQQPGPGLSTRLRWSTIIAVLLGLILVSTNELQAQVKTVKADADQENVKVSTRHVSSATNQGSEPSRRRLADFPFRVGKGVWTGLVALTVGHSSRLTLNGQIIAFRPADRILQFSSHVLNSESFLFKVSSTPQVIKLVHEHFGYSTLGENLLDKSPMLKVSVRRDKSCDETYRDLALNSPTIKSKAVDAPKVIFIGAFQENELAAAEIVKCYKLEKVVIRDQPTTERESTSGRLNFDPKNERGATSNLTRSRKEPNQETAALITNLQRGSIEEVSRAIHALHALGNKAIPSLIESISSDHYVANLLRDPTSSYIQDGSLTQFAGVRSAYVIELILAQDKLPSTKVKKTSFVLGTQPQNYLYSQAVIVDEAKQPIRRPDLPRVKDIYQQWWEGNKGKSIEALRNAWLGGERPLKGQAFSWNVTGPVGAPRSSREQQDQKWHVQPPSLCLLQQQISGGSHQTVRVSGVFSEGLQLGTLADAKCPEEITWVELDLRSERNKEKLSRLLNRSRRAYVVVEGDFYGPPLPDSNLPEAIRKSYHPGWGHLAAFRTKLVVHAILDVKAVSTNGNSPEN